MEKLEIIKREIESDLLTEKYASSNIEDRMIKPESFEKFARIFLKTINESADLGMKKNIMQKFIHRIEIGVDQIKVKWKVDRLHYESETHLLRMSSK